MGQKLTQHLDITEISDTVCHPRFKKKSYTGFASIFRWTGKQKEPTLLGQF